MKVAICLGLSVLVVAGLSACSDSPDSSQATPSRPPITVIPFGGDGDHPVLRNKDGEFGKTRDTGVTVMSGDRVEIQPSYLVREDRKPLPPKVTRQDNNVCTQYTDVCVATTPIMQQQCTRKCKHCEDCNIFGCTPNVCCEDSCQDVHTGDRCVATEKRCAQQSNQWTEQTVYEGLGDPKSVRIRLL